MSTTRASNDRPPGAGGVKRGRLQQEVAATGSRVTVVLGAQWGDEGKGKVVDLLATDADIISRCQVRRRSPPSEPPPHPTQTRHASRSPSSWGHLPSGHPHPPTQACNAHSPRSHFPPARNTPPRRPHPPARPTPTAAAAQGQSYKYKSC